MLTACTRADYVRTCVLFNQFKAIYSNENFIIAVASICIKLQRSDVLESGLLANASGCSLPSTLSELGLLQPSLDEISQRSQFLGNKETFLGF